MSSLRRLLLAQAQATPHTELSYLRSSGGSFIDTGIKGSGNISVELKLVRGTMTSFFGSRISASNATFQLLGISATTIRSDYNNSYSETFNADQTNIYTIKKFKNLTYLDDVLVSTHIYATFNSNLNMYLFASNQNGILSTSGTGDIYCCKIWDNDILVRDFIPVLKTDGTYCAYDKVSGTYFLNQGAGSFTGA